MQNEFEKFIIVGRKAGLIIWPHYNIITLFFQLKNAGEPLPPEPRPAAAPVLSWPDGTLRCILTTADEPGPADSWLSAEPATIHLVKSDAAPRPAIASK